MRKSKTYITSDVTHLDIYIIKKKFFLTYNEEIKIFDDISLQISNMPFIANEPSHFFSRSGSCWSCPSLAGSSARARPWTTWTTCCPGSTCPWLWTWRSSGGWQSPSSATPVWIITSPTSRPASWRPPPSSTASRNASDGAASTPGRLRPRRRLSARLEPVSRSWHTPGERT